MARLCFTYPHGLGHGGYVKHKLSVIFEYTFCSWYVKHQPEYKNVARRRSFVLVYALLGKKVGFKA
jgi:hypothetical protein